MAGEQISADQRTMMLLSYLTVLIHRNGGTLKIDNLSEYEGRLINLKMDLRENSVTLTCSEIKPQSN